MDVRRWKLGRLLFIAAFTASCIESDPFDLDSPRSCEVSDQNEWVLGLMEEVYLWNEMLPEVDPAEYESAGELVRALRYEQDRWSRVSDKTSSDALFKKGMILSYGWRTKRDDQNNVRLASVHALSSAGEAGLLRGDRIVAINGMTTEELDAMELWGDVLGPGEPGVTIDVEIESIADASVQTVELVKDWVEIVTVSTREVLSHGDRTVGYLVFETFVDPATDALKDAFASFKEQGVDTMIVDLRYNGGGLLSVSSLLANLLAGAKADGEVMYRREFNEALSDQNRSTRFERREESVDVDEVVFITSRNTVSASELVINSLRPYVDVFIVGDNTGGKPFGMLSWDFCEQVIFPVTFRMVNAEGSTDYFDGLTPDCVAVDDLDHALGSPEEGSLSEALRHLDGVGCSSTALPSTLGRATQQLQVESSLYDLLGGTW